MVWYVKDRRCNKTMSNQIFTLKQAYMLESFFPEAGQLLQRILQILQEPSPHLSANFFIARSSLIPLFCVLYLT
jgi:hypothetical protein